MASTSRSAWHVAAALVIGLVVAGAPAAYFYSQNSALQGKQTILNSQISSLQSREASLEANITALTTQKAGLSANATASEQRIQQLDSQIANLNSNINSLQTQWMNAENQIVLLQSHENLSATQVIDSTPLSWSGSPCTTTTSGPTSACLTVAYNYGPYNVTDFAGYLNFTFTNPSPSNVQIQVNVTWDGYGYHYSSIQTVTGTGTIIFPVLLTNDLNFIVKPITSTGSVHLTILWYD